MSQRIGEIGTIVNPVSIHGTVDLYSDVVIGTVAVTNIGTLAHVNVIGTIETIKAISSVTTGSVGILDQPVGIHGTVDLYSDVTIGTVNISGTLSVSVISGSIDNISSVGTISQLDNISTIGTIERLNIIGTIAEVKTVQGGSIALIGGSVSLMYGQGEATKTSQNIDVLSTSTIILNPNPNRKYMAFNNYGGTAVYLGFGGNAIIQSGISIPAPPAPNFMEFGLTKMFRGTITGVQAAGADGTVAVGVAEW